LDSLYTGQLRAVARNAELSGQNTVLHGNR
jgi:hypothetical protein